MQRNVNNAENAMIKEIIKQVLDRDTECHGPKQYDINNVTLDYLNTLDDITRLGRDEIEHIAREVISGHKKATQENMTDVSFIKPINSSRKTSVLPFKVIIFTAIILVPLLIIMQQYNAQLSASIEHNNETALTNNALTSTQNSTEIKSEINHEPINNAQPATESSQQQTHAEQVRIDIYYIMSVVQNTKVQINDFFMQQGQLPNDSDDVALLTDNLNALPSIKAVFINKGAILVIQLNDKYGDDIAMIFTPTLSNNQTRLQWQCQTNLSETYQINLLNPVCKYNSSVRQFGLPKIIWAK